MDGEKCTCIGEEKYEEQMARIAEAYLEEMFAFYSEESKDT